MAILGPTNMPSVFRKQDTDPLKLHAVNQLGGPSVAIEVTESQWEESIKTAMDFICQYFPLESKIAYFYTQPTVIEYDIPEDAYWIVKVSWDPVTTRIDSIFGAESFLFNIGNISGIQNMLLDYHLLLHYRKWSQRVLGTEGRWDFVSHSKIRLHPNPKSTFPVIVEYMPRVTEFQSPIARQLVMDMMVAETKIMLGHARRKFASFPAPDGSTITLDGAQLVTEGNEEKEKVRQKALLWGEPMMCHIA